MFFSVWPTHMLIRSEARFWVTSRPNRSARYRVHALFPVPGGP